MTADESQVEPIVKKFHGHQGLKKLKVIGLRDSKCLEELRKGLVGPSGGFEVIW